MKKAYILLLSLLLILGVAGCGLLPQPSAPPPEIDEQEQEVGAVTSTYAANNVVERKHRADAADSTYEYSYQPQITNDPPIDLWNYHEKYGIGILHMVGLTTQQWGNIEEIGLDDHGRPIIERIMRFYQIHYSSRIDQLISRGEMRFDESLRGDNFIFPDDVEDFLMFRFDVSREFLRTSEQFDSQSGLYIIPYIDGFGGGATPYLASVERAGNDVTLIYYILDIWETSPEGHSLPFGPNYAYNSYGYLVLTNWETRWELLIRHDGDSFQYVSNRQIGQN